MHHTYVSMKNHKPYKEETITTQFEEIEEQTSEPDRDLEIIKLNI